MQIQTKVWDKRRILESSGYGLGTVSPRQWEDRKCIISLNQSLILSIFFKTQKVTAISQWTLFLRDTDENVSVG